MNLKKYIKEIFNFMDPISPRDIRFWIMDSSMTFDNFEKYYKTAVNSVLA